MHNLIHKVFYKSPVGILEITGCNGEILSLGFVDKKENTFTQTPEYLLECYRQIDEYFKGTRTEFFLEISIQGTDFEKKVYNELLNIPYGQTVSYKDIARSIGNEKAVKAVGNANRKNKIAIIIPCHRVIGSNGKMVGYAEGIWRKEWLLKHEKKFHAK